MPIYIGDSAQSEFSGKVSATMGSFGVDFDGTTTPGVDIDGSFNRTLGSFTASFQDNITYPQIATARGNNPNYGQDDAASAVDRAAIGSVDASLVQGLDSGGHMDPPVISGYLPRVDVTKEILAGNSASQHRMYTYFNMMEIGDDGSLLATYLDNVTGPNGTDGWVYDRNGVKKEFFFPTFGANITDEVQVDGNGFRYPEYYAENWIQPNYIDPHIVAGVKIGGPNGINCMFDNVQHHANKSDADWDADGNGNDTGDFYDPEELQHTALNVAVSSLTRSGTTATCVTATDHGLSDDSRVIIAGADQSEYNGTLQEANEGGYTITNDTTFTYTVAGSPASPATGTITTTVADRHGTPGHISATLYGQWRANYRKGIERVKFNNPNMNFLPNTNQWGDQTDPAQIGTWTGSVSGLRNIITEYRLGGATDTAWIDGGFSEGNVHDGQPRSGVNQTGVNNGTAGSWQKMYNSAYIATTSVQPPAVVFMSGWVECLQSGSTGAAGRTTYPNEPISTSKWHLFRWLFATAQIVGAHVAIAGVRPGTTSGRGVSTPIFDEYGLTNTSTTKLFRKWMGKRLSDPPTTAWDTHATGELWLAEFENALIIVNTDNDETNPPASVAPGDLPGGDGAWMFFNGAQDTSQNDGSTVSTIPSQLDPIDAFILVRKSWYDAL